MPHDGHDHDDHTHDQDAHTRDQAGSAQDGRTQSTSHSHGHAGADHHHREDGHGQDGHGVGGHGPNHDGDDHDHHGHGHSHGHSHGHGFGHHHHGPAKHDAAFAIGVGLNTALVAGQIAVGLIAGSMALLADAVHNLGDVLGLLLAWGAIVLGRRAPSALRTYGWGRSTILASLANAMLLLVSIGAIGIEAIQRLAHIAPVDAKLVAILGAAGLLVNGATALLFMRGSDAALSAGVVIAALIIMATGWFWLDPLVSLAIAATIAIGTWSLLRESMNLAMDAVPAGLDLAEIEGFLHTLPCVHEVHDLHVWALSTTQNAVTAHLVQHDIEPNPPETLITAAARGLRDKFGISHATIQVETMISAQRCGLRPASVV
jgi:cobalt-zinc-cadmium efflux system protein